MSYLHHLEPATKGRVKVHTSHGAITIHLWSVEAVQTCRNFIQHALNGTYNNLPFHRITAEVAQTGDPTGEGDGGEAANGGSLEIETHRKLKFRRRGLAAMVGDGGVRSQWFLTLKEAGWLDGKHGIFGCVGDGVFNMLELGREGGRVVSVEVEENPFADIVKQVVRGEEEKKEVISAKRAVRRRNLLSFADAGDGEGEDGFVMRKVRRGNERPKDEESLEGRQERDDEKSKGGKDEDVIRKANEEFERLKAAMMGGKKDRKEENERMHDANRGGEEDMEVEKEEVKRDVVRKKRKDESETLRRLKEFENRVRKERKGGGRAWFAKGLKLASVAMEEEEYEVLQGKNRRKWKQKG